MNKRLMGVTAVVAILHMPLLTSAQTDPAWPWKKFEDPKLLTVHIVCDEGTSEYKSYLNTPHTFTGMTIKVKGGHVLLVLTQSEFHVSGCIFLYREGAGQVFRSNTVGTRPGDQGSSATVLPSNVGWFKGGV